MNAASAKSDAIQQLQQQILSMQGLSRPVHAEAIDTGLGPIEHAFPDNTFPVGAIHEFISNAPADSAATSGFLTGLISHLMQPKGICLWISIRRHTFPPALKRFGVNPEQIVFVDAARDKDALWAMEEGLKCGALNAVVGEFNTLDFTASRRLQLAVEQSRVTGFIHRSQLKAENTVACVSRWKITSLASATNGNAPGIRFPRWNVALTKVRNGRTGSWQIEWTPKGFREVPATIPMEAYSAMRKTG